MKKIVSIVTVAVLLCGCGNNRIKVTVRNTLGFDRSAETVEIPLADVRSKLPDFNASEIVVTDKRGNEVPSQIVFAGEPEPQLLIFQADVKAGREAVYYISRGIPSEYEPKAYGRFVPERMDDYAWENDRIAFRIYGPALIAKDGPSNGIDVWVKRTDRLVINRWYADYLAGKNSYHDDNGEGCDCFKVGRTLGAGAMAPFVNDSLWLAINFETYETLDNGPVRTSFRLKYPPFMINDITVSETRTISLDAGSQLTRVTEEFNGYDREFPVAAGIATRPEGSIMSLDKNSGAIAYRLDGGEGGITFIGTVLTTPVLSVMEKSNHLLIVTEYFPGRPLTYYTGAGWSKWGFSSDQSWIDYVEQFSQKVQTPLQVRTE